MLKEYGRVPVGMCAALRGSCMQSGADNAGTHGMADASGGTAVAPSAEVMPFDEVKGG